MGLISEKRVRIWEGDRGDEGAVTAGKGAPVAGWLRGLESGESRLEKARESGGCD